MIGAYRSANFSEALAAAARGGRIVREGGARVAMDWRWSDSGDWFLEHCGREGEIQAGGGRSNISRLALGKVR